MHRIDKKVRVLICNNCTLFREGIKALFQEEMDVEVVAEAKTAKQAIDQAKRLNPDVVLMDVVTPDLSGHEATRRIKTLRPDIKILILTMHDDEELITRCLEAGAAGYLAKGDHSSELQAAIEAVSRTGRYQHPEAA